MRYILPVLLSVTTLLYSCKKFLNVSPPANALIDKTVFQSDATATSAMNGIYESMANSGFVSGRSSIGVTMGDYADEFIEYSNNYLNYFSNNVNSGMTSPNWSQMYNIIYTTNSVIEGI
jgi:starch-binding outer membrane protein, SusD/RagB family